MSENRLADMLRDARTDDDKFEAAIDIVTKLAEWDDIPFWGCENCEDWNGVDRRCSCGNRRAYWEYDEDTKSYRGEAY